MEHFVHTPAPGIALYSPAVQLMHDVEPPPCLSLYLPDGQSVHAKEAANEYLPTAHMPHALLVFCSGRAENLPAAQSVHDNAPEFSGNSLVITRKKDLYSFQTPTERQFSNQSGEFLDVPSSEIVTRVIDGVGESSCAMAYPSWFSIIQYALSSF
jgi:hypothetical protein